jgi:acetamidase/formamidase
MSLTLKFHVHKDLELEEPQFILNKNSEKEKKINYYVTTGISPDLLNATKKAVKYMISYLTSNYNLTSQEAYILCSVVLKLKINQVVNKPNWVVSAYIPLNLLS